MTSNKWVVTQINAIVDPAWYLDTYPDVRKSAIDPLLHFVDNGLTEGRDPNPFFDGSWYLARYPDVAAANIPPLLHYMQHGASELRDPHPHFDAVYYVEQVPEARSNPLLYHLRIGRERRLPTERFVDLADYLPFTAVPNQVPDGIAVSIVIPVYRGLEETQRCLYSVLRDEMRMAGDVIVIDDCSPEPELSKWLHNLAIMRRIRLIRNPRNLGFVGSVNRGMREAGRHDVILLNSDTEVPRDWTRRLAAHAYSAPRIASVSPFSNRATICSYPVISGSNLAFDLPLEVIDEHTRLANTGRSVRLPTTVGFCMYIRRAALNEVGDLDEKAFRRGYGEENDFCLRATAHGWEHRLACDTFVYHEGEVSFGANSPEHAQGLEVLNARYPEYASDIARHVAADPAAPARFALTVSLFRASDLPCVLMVSHDLGGGVLRHIDTLIADLKGVANVLLLKPHARGIGVSIPGIEGHPVLTVATDRVEDLAKFLTAVPVTRVHIHHTIGLEFDLRELLHRIALPFDVTLHDYYGICPQVNLLPRLEGAFCGEPGPAICNACIADRVSHGACEILSWRHRNAWLYREAERVLCPSEDARDRLLRFVPSAPAVLAPHEPVRTSHWVMPRPPQLRPGRPLRVAMIGVLASHKGAPAAIALAENADPATIKLHLIGYPEETLPPLAGERIKCTGKYEESELANWIARIRPHVLWFPARWPETYSYTLSAAIEAGLPIVASCIGAFPERLADRPLTWLCSPDSSTSDWENTFAAVRKALSSVPQAGGPILRPQAFNFYAESYPNSLRAKRSARKLIDLRRSGRLSVVVVPETHDNGVPTPCAYIRLLQQLDHPAIVGDIDVVLADPKSALSYRADVIATHRYAVPDKASANCLAAHCHENSITLLYDIDDELINIPIEHPEYSELILKAALVAHMIDIADVVWASTESLCSSLARVGCVATLIPNALDERIWSEFAAPVKRMPVGPVRIVYMGTATHNDDFTLVEPALARLVVASQGRIRFDMIGVSTKHEMPDWVNRIVPSTNAVASYPGFVNWITQQNRWDIGIAPLVNSSFNRCKSAIKTMDYAALGLAVLASDMPVFRGSLADGPGGMLVAERAEAWYAALAQLTNDPYRRHSLAIGGRAAFLALHTLGAQAAERQLAWHALFGAKRPAANRVGKGASNLTKKRGKIGVL